MKPVDQIKALAELDNVEEISERYEHAKQCPIQNCGYGLKPYLTSLDAIVPLIEKQPMNIQLEVAIQLRIYYQRNEEIYPGLNNLEGWMLWTITSTPAQLCEVLLRATGKWKE